MSDRPGTHWLWGLEFPQDWIATWLIAMSGPVFLLTLIWLVVRLDLRLSGRRDRTGLPRASTLVVLAALAYNIGFWAGGVLTPLPQDEECRVASEDFRFSSTSVLPLHNYCHLATGDVFDLVPWWVNPAVGGLLLAAVVRAVQSRVSANPPSTESKDEP